MGKGELTLFTWGYEGWGNWTDKLIEAADAVERSRGWGSPVFVDVRASRKVRAEGFREKAFEKRHGPDRYRWMPGLGNKAILTGEKYGSLVDPHKAADLLDLAAELHSQRRRAIYFCSCPSPTDGCHRHWIADHVFELAKAREQAVTIVEWPGYESEPGAIPEVKTSEAILRALDRGQRASVPLGVDTPSPGLMGLPWFTPVDLVDEEGGKLIGFTLAGPAQHRAKGWQLPDLGPGGNADGTLERQRKAREVLLALPRSWPASSPSQKPHKWTQADIREP